MADTFLTFRFLHILSALAWAGAAITLHALIAKFSKAGKFDVVGELMTSALSIRLHVVAGLATIVFGVVTLLNEAEGFLPSDGGDLVQFNVLSTGMTFGFLAWLGQAMLYGFLQPRMVAEGLEGHDKTKARNMIDRVSVLFLVLGMLGMTAWRLF